MIELLLLPLCAIVIALSKVQRESMMSSIRDETQGWFDRAV